MKTHKNRIGPLLNPCSRRRNSDDDNEERYKRKEPGYAKDCCCCSYPMITGFVIGLLICVVGLAPALTILLIKSGETPSTSIATAAIPVVESVASTVSTAISSNTADTASSSLSYTSISSSLTIITTSATSTTTTAPDCTTRVTFDNIPGQSPPSGAIPNGYENLNWTNAQYLYAPSAPLNSGYQTAVSSSPYIAYNPGGTNVTITTANGTRFALNSIVIAPAWRDNLIWSIYGYSAGTLMLSASIPIFVVNHTIVSCGTCSNWDTIYMTTSGGIPHPGLSQNGTEFGFDNLCISFGY